MTFPTQIRLLQAVVIVETCVVAAIAVLPLIVLPFRGMYVVYVLLFVVIAWLDYRLLARLSAYQHKAELYEALRRAAADVPRGKVRYLLTRDGTAVGIAPGENRLLPDRFFRFEDADIEAIERLAPGEMGQVPLSIVCVSRLLPVAVRVFDVDQMQKKGDGEAPEMVMPDPSSGSWTTRKTWWGLQSGAIIPDKEELVELVACIEGAEASQDV